MSLMSYRAYSRHRGVTLRTVQKAIESGRIKTTTNEKGKKAIDSIEADKRWATLSDPSKQIGGGKTKARLEREPVEPNTVRAGADDPIGELGEDDAPDYYKSKSLREHNLALMAQLEYRERSGELVEAKAIQEQWLKIITVAKTRMLAVPSKVRARVPHLTTADMATIDEEIRQALEELAQEADE